MEESAQTSTDRGLLVRRRILLAIPLIVTFIACVVLFAWFFNIESLKRVAPAFPAMSPVTAVNFIILGCCFLALQLKPKESLRKLFVLILSVLALIISSTRLFEITTNRGLGIDLLLFREQILQTASPARMAEATALCFLLLSLAIIVTLLIKKSWSTLVSQLLALASLMLSIAALIFYLIDSFIFLQNRLFFSMAVHTAFLFMLFSIGWFIHLTVNGQKKIILQDLRFLFSSMFILSGLWFFITFPQLKRLPSNFEFSAQIFSTDNLYDSKNKTFIGDSISSTTFTYKTVSRDENIIELEAIFDVKQQSGEPIFKVSRVYGIDTITNQHQPGFGNKDREGYLFAPPGKDENKFLYWHVNYDQPLEMRFVGEEYIKELKVLKYESIFKADQTKELSNLPEVGDTKGIELDGVLTLWIEPNTGRMVKYEDSANAYYYDLASGERLEPWNSFSNTFTEPSVNQQIEIIQGLMQKQFIVQYVIPSILFSIGLILLIFYLISTFTSLRLEIYLPTATLIIGIIIVTIVQQTMIRVVNHQVEKQFENETTEIEEAIKNNLAVYAQTLQATKGLFESSSNVDREAFKIYTDTLAIQSNFPGIQGIGYSVFVQPEDLEQHIQEIRAEGFPNFTVSPEGEREIYSSIVYLEPFDFRNQRAFGYDMFQQETRRQAMEKARDKNTITISGKITLVQEVETDIQSGFLMYVPLYKRNEPLSTVEERRNNILGYVYSPFRMKDLIKNIYRNQRYKLVMEIYDGTTTNPELHMLTFNLEEKTENNPTKNPKLTKQVLLEVYDHQWIVRFVALPSYGLGIFQESAPLIIIIIGGTIVSVITIATYTLASGRSRAINLANEITGDLKEKTQKLDDYNKNLENEVKARKQIEKNLKSRTIELEKMNNLMVNRELKMIELKKQIQNKNK